MFALVPRHSATQCASSQVPSYFSSFFRREWVRILAEKGAMCPTDGPASVRRRVVMSSLSLCVHLVANFAKNRGCEVYRRVLPCLMFTLAASNKEAFAEKKYRECIPLCSSILLGKNLNRMAARSDYKPAGKRDCTKRGYTHRVLPRAFITSPLGLVDCC